MNSHVPHPHFPLLLSHTFNEPILTFYPQLKSMALGSSGPRCFLRLPWAMVTLTGSRAPGRRFVDCWGLADVFCDEAETRGFGKGGQRTEVRFRHVSSKAHVANVTCHRSGRRDHVTEGASVRFLYCVVV